MVCNWSYDARVLYLAYFYCKAKQVSNLLREHTALDPKEGNQVNRRSQFGYRKIKVRTQPQVMASELDNISR